jgi:hypothetical protein
VTRVKRLLKLGAALIAWLLYVWFETVRLLPTVKRRKAARRRRPRMVKTP